MTREEFFTYLINTTSINPAAVAAATEIWKNAQLSQEAWDHLSTQFAVTSQDRDARRRRMELAQFILNYEQSLDIDAIWGVATGTLVAVTEDEYKQWQSIFLRPRTEPRSFGVAIDQGAQPMYNDLTQQPTELKTLVFVAQKLVDGTSTLRCQETFQYPTDYKTQCIYAEVHVGAHMDNEGTEW